MYQEVFVEPLRDSISYRYRSNYLLPLRFIWFYICVCVTLEYYDRSYLLCHLALLVVCPQLLKKQTYLPQRDPGGDLLMAVDHCFSIRGQGTVMTGTILQGSLAVNDTVEIPALKVHSKTLT